MTNDKNITPTIEESLRIIKKKLAENKKNKKTTTSANTVREVEKKSISQELNLSSLFEENNKDIKNIAKKKNDEEVLLLTKKVDENGKIIDLRKKKEAVFKKKETRNKNKNEKNKSLDIKIVNYKVLNKTGDMAIIISKLKEIRDHKISKIKEKKHSNKIKQEIRKLNETIALAEDLFKKELLNL